MATSSIMECAKFKSGKRPTDITTQDPALRKRLDVDEQFKVVFDAIRALMTPPENSKRKIGFKGKD